MLRAFCDGYMAPRPSLRQRCKVLTLTPQRAPRSCSLNVTLCDPAEGGGNGIHFAKVLDRLAIANEMQSKTIFAPKASALGPMVGNGEAEIGVLSHQLFYGVPGIEIVGPLPTNLQGTTMFSAALMNSS